MLAVLNGLGLAICPDWVAAPEIQQGRLVRVLCDYQIEPKGTEVNAVYPARKFLPTKVRAYIDYLSDSFNQV